MNWPERLLEYATLAVLVAIALTVAFCAQDNTSLRARMWSTRCRWVWAAKDCTSTAVIRGRTVTATSTRQTAMRLLRDVIGDL